MCRKMQGPVWPKRMTFFAGNHFLSMSVHHGKMRSKSANAKSIAPMFGVSGFAVVFSRLLSLLKPTSVLLNRKKGTAE